MLQISDLPDAILVNVATFLSSPSQALFAAAMTAPSSSWQKVNWMRQPSELSKAIIKSSSPTESNQLQDQVQQHKEQWSHLDFVDIEKNLANKLTDGDLGALLACINARQTLKTLKLTGCINIAGYGLEPLRSSVCLEQINLSLVRQHERPTIEPEPLISDAAILPILDSIIDIRGCAFKHIQVPKKWCDENETEAIASFLSRYNELFIQCGLSCSKCERNSKKDWILSRGFQNHICYNCLKPVCDDCEIHNGQPFLQYCDSCEKHFCADCVSVEVACSECYRLCCRGCRETSTTCGKCFMVSWSWHQCLISWVVAAGLLALNYSHTIDVRAKTAMNSIVWIVMVYYGLH